MPVKAENKHTKPRRDIIFFQFRQRGHIVSRISYSVQSALLGGSGGMPPRKILNFRLSEIDSGVVLGQISYRVGDQSS